MDDTGYVVVAKAKEGDTVARIAERYNASLDEVVQENPNLANDAALSAGDEVFVPIGVPAVASAPTAGAKVLMALSQWATHRGLGPQDAPTAPVLTVSGGGCTASLSIRDGSDTEQGFNIYRLNPGAMSFSKLTTLPAHEGSGTLTYQDSNLFGLYSYYVAAFDAEGEAASNLVSLNVVDSNCAGKPTTIDELTSIPAGVEDYYLYVSINNGTWRRFPADDFTYLKKSQNLDFGAVGASLAPNMVGAVSMRGEVWGVVNGTAIMLGTFEKSFKANQPQAAFEPSGFYNSLTTKLDVRGVYNPSTGSYPWFMEKGKDPEVRALYHALAKWVAGRQQGK